MAQLIKRGQMWYSDLRVHGKRIRQPLSIYRPIAEKMLRDIVGVRTAAKWGLVPETMSWILFKQRFLAYRSDKAPHTYYRSRKMCQVVEKELKPAQLREITPDRALHLRQLMKASKSPVYGPTSINRLLRELKTAMHFAEKMNYVPIRNWKVIETPEPSGRLDFYEMDDFVRVLQILKKTDSPWYTAVYLMGRAGLRREELHMLEWPDIQFHHRRIFLSAKPHLKWKLKSDKFGTRTRFIPLNIVPNLEDHLRSIARPDGFVLGDIRPAHVKTLGNKIGDTLEETGIVTHLKNFGTAHVLRHSYASHLAQQGVPLQQISSWMGHTTTRMTQIYAHLMPDYKGSVKLMETAKHDKKALSTLCPLGSGL